MRLAILLAALGSVALDAAAAADDGVASAAHFALIHPDADDAPELSPGAVWLYRPRKTSGKATSPAAIKRTRATSRPGEKSAAPVAPLRRERPKKETSPPTTRRRRLGW